MTMSLDEGTPLGSYQILALIGAGGMGEGWRADVRTSCSPSFPDVGNRVQISTAGGTEPMWSRDGRELFYRNGEKMMVVTASTDLDFTPSKPTLLFEGIYVAGVFGGTPGVNYDVAPDGQRFLMVKSEEGLGSTQLNINLNWSEELKRLAPIN